MKRRWVMETVEVEVTTAPVAAEEGDVVVWERRAEGGLRDAAAEGADEVRDAAAEGSEAGDVRALEPACGARPVLVTPPTWVGGHRSEFVQLERLWQETLTAARDGGSARVVTPAMGTTGTGFPVPEASRVAFNTVARFAREGSGSVRSVRVHVSAAEEAAWLDGLDEVMRTMTGTPGAA